MSHWVSPKQHSFCEYSTLSLPKAFGSLFGSGLTRRIVVDSRSGSLYCHNCDDYVYDPHFERLRLSNGNFAYPFSHSLSHVLEKLADTTTTTTKKDAKSESLTNTPPKMTIEPSLPIPPLCLVEQSASVAFIIWVIPAS
jgi:hypothetical protein